MASETFSLKSRKNLWTSFEVYTLLATFNSAIEDIRREFEADKRTGVEFAASLLSEAVGNGCTPDRVTSKIKMLWINARPDIAGKQPDPLYLHGAWTRTMPGLDNLYPGMLEELSKAGMRQRNNITHGRPQTHSYSLRRNKEDEYNDPYDCRCGYFHYASSSIHCSKCHTWQHVWCYYSTDEQKLAPDDHMCDRCTIQDDSALDSNAMLHQAMSNLDIRSDPVYIRGGSNNTNNKCPAKPEPSIANEFFGFDAKEIHLKARSITSAIEVIAHSLNHENFELRKPSARSLKHQSDIWNIFEVLGLDTENKMIFSSEEQTNLLKSVLAASIWQWTFYAPEHASALGNPSTYQEAISYGRAQISLDLRERKALRTIHYKVWNHLAIDKPEILQPMITGEAEKLTHRLFRMLSIFLTSKKSTLNERFLRRTEDWIYHTTFGMSRFKHIRQLFDKCIKLRNLFAISEYYYELYFPRSADTRYMVHEKEDKNKKVQFCFTPAILEYEPDHAQRTEWGVSIVIGSQRFINATPEKRQESRLAYPAVVKFWE